MLKTEQQCNKLTGKNPTKLDLDDGEGVEVEGEVGR